MSSDSLDELRVGLNLTEPFIGLVVELSLLAVSSLAGWHVRLHVQDELRIGKCPNIEQHLQAREGRRRGCGEASDDPEVVQKAQQLCPELEVGLCSAVRSDLTADSSRATLRSTDLCSHNAAG
eukprot:760229-Hanusia_phi.AAC.1